MAAGSAVGGDTALGGNGAGGMIGTGGAAGEGARRHRRRRRERASVETAPAEAAPAEPAWAEPAPAEPARAARGVGGTGVGGHVGRRRHRRPASIAASIAIVDVTPDLPVCDIAHGMHRVRRDLRRPTRRSPTAARRRARRARCRRTRSPPATERRAASPATRASCRSAAPACAPATPTARRRATTVTLPGGRFTGTTTGTSLNAGSCGGGNAPEAVYQMVLTQTSDVFVTTHGSKFDTVIYMRSGCCGTEIACNDNADGRTTSVLNATRPGRRHLRHLRRRRRHHRRRVHRRHLHQPERRRCRASRAAGRCASRTRRSSATPAAIATTTARQPRAAAPTTAGSTSSSTSCSTQPTTVSFDTCTEHLHRQRALHPRRLHVATMVDRDRVQRRRLRGRAATASTRRRSQSKVQRAARAGAHYVVLDTFVNPRPSPPAGCSRSRPATFRRSGRALSARRAAAGRGSRSCRRRAPPAPRDRGRTRSRTDRGARRCWRRARSAPADRRPSRRSG